MNENFQDSIDLMSIVKVLATIRAHRASIAHANAFYAANFGQDKPMDVADDGLCELLPSRREWARPLKIQRGGRGSSKERISRDAIIRKVQGVIAADRLAAYAWGRKLQDFVNRLIRRVEDCCFDISMPRLFLKAKDDGKDGPYRYRCLASYDKLEDRVLIALAAKYLSKKLDPTFSPCSYAFRTSIPLTYNSAVRRLRNYRLSKKGKVYVTNCDIKKFFDRISHAVIMAAVRAHRDLIGEQMVRLIESYLGSYDFDRARELLRNEFPDEFDQVDGVHERIGKGRGIPQGGALSSLLSNLVLDQLDKIMTSSDDDGERFYARYCDDIVIAHTNKSCCSRYLRMALATLVEIGVPAHDLRYVASYSPDFYEAKSRSVYVWASPNLCADAIPWVPFLGYCVSFEGEVRIRKETLLRHLKSIQSEVGYFKNRLLVRKWHDLKKLRQVVAQFIVRMTRKGVGSVDAHRSASSGRCWFAAFPLLKNTPNARRQMRFLDKWRTKMIVDLLAFSRLSNQTHYLGYPYSYVGALENAVRWKLAKTDKYKLDARDEVDGSREENVAIENNEEEDELDESDIAEIEYEYGEEDNYEDTWQNRHRFCICS